MGKIFNLKWYTFGLGGIRYTYKVTDHSLCPLQVAVAQNADRTFEPEIVILNYKTSNKKGETKIFRENSTNFDFNSSYHSK